ncbi:MAG: hypothetical protein R3F49_05900 [Planctomycetota bacterium]
MTSTAQDEMDHDALRAALAPLAPEREAFRALVRARIEAGRGSGRSGAAPPPDRPDRPAWLRRAAAILPPGVLEFGVLSKAGGAAQGLGGASALSWLTAPWLILGAGLVGWLGALRATARLDGSEAPVDALPPLGARATTAARHARSQRKLIALVPWLVVFWAPMLAYAPILVALFSGSTTVWTLALVCFSVGLTAGVLLLSRAGLADRRSVAQLALQGLSQLVVIAVIAQSGLAFAGPLTRFGTVPLLVLGVIALGRAAQAPAGLHATLSLLQLALFGLGMIWIAPRCLDWDAPRFVEWIETRTPAIDDLGTWEVIGQIARELPPETRAALDLDGMRATLDEAQRTGLRPHYVVGLAASRAGILTPELLQVYARNRLLRDNAFKSPRPYLVHANESDTLDVLAMRAQGLLGSSDAHGASDAREASPSAEHRMRVLDGIARGLPAPDEFHALLELDGYLTMADALGDAELATRERARIQHALALAFEPDVNGRAGFNAWPQGNATYIPYIDEASSLAAVRLMRRVGAPDQVDLAAFADGATLAAASHGLRAPSNSEVQAALLRYILQRDLPVPPTTFAARLAREAVFLAALAATLLALWTVWRAPTRPSADEGPLGRGSI